MELSLFTPGSAQHRPRYLRDTLRFSRRYPGGTDGELSFEVPYIPGREYPWLEDGCRVVLEDGLTKVWRGRVTARELIGEDRLGIYCLGNWKFLQGAPYGETGKLWAEPRFDRWEMLSPGLDSALSRASENYEVDTSGQLFIMPRENETYKVSAVSGCVTDYGGAFYRNARDDVAKIRMTYSASLAGDWQAVLHMKNADWGSGSTITTFSASNSGSGLLDQSPVTPRATVMLLLQNYLPSGPPLIDYGYGLPAARTWGGDQTVAMNVGSPIQVGGYNNSGSGLGTDKSGHFLYVGMREWRFTALYFTMSWTNTCNVRLDAQYFNSGCGWVGCKGWQDLTKAATLHSLGQSGSVTWRLPVASDPRWDAIEAIGGKGDLYYVRVGASPIGGADGDCFGGATDQVQIAGIRILQIPEYIHRRSDVAFRVSKVELFGSSDASPTLPDVAKNMVGQLSASAEFDIRASCALITSACLKDAFSPVVFEGDDCYAALESLAAYGDSNERNIGWGVEGGGNRVFLESVATDKWKSSMARYLVDPRDVAEFSLQKDIGGLVTEAFGVWEDDKGLSHATSLYYAVRDMQPGQKGVSAASAVGSRQQKMSEYLGVRHRETYDLGSVSASSAAGLAVEQALGIDGRPAIRTSLRVANPVLDRKMNMSLVPPQRIEPGYLVMLPRMDAIGSDGTAGDDLRDGENIFRVAQVDWDNSGATLSLEARYPGILGQGQGRGDDVAKKRAGTRPAEERPGEANRGTGKA